MYEFRKASNDFKFQMEEELRNSEEADRRKKEEELQRTIALTAPTTVPTTLEAPIAETAENPYASEASDPPAASVPVIQPPSTGEQVSAARPHMAPVTDAAAEANIGSDAAPSVLPDEPSEDQTAAEQATHHG
jgi:sec-independent protein translocase protein TatB